VFALLFALGYFMLEDVPGANASADELNEYYATGERTPVVIAALYVVPFAGIAFMWFLAALRQRVLSVSLREDLLFGTVQLLSGVLFVGMTFVSAAARAAPALAVEIGGADIPEGGRELLIFGEAALMVYAFRCAGVFMIATTVRAVRAGVVPPWFRIVSIAAALVLVLSASYLTVLTLVLPAWVGSVSLFVLFRARRGRLAAEA
jgi:hypothetical protein